MKKRILTAAVSLVVAACLLFAGGQAAGLYDFFGGERETVTISKAEYEQLKRFAPLSETLTYIEAWYLEEPDVEKLLDYAGKGMIAGLSDPYSVYYTAKEWKDMWADDEGVYVGIGVMLQGNPDTQLVTVIQVFHGGPAEAAGVRKGDVLIRVEDIDVSYFTMQDAVNLMRGVEGEPTEIEVLRNGERIVFPIVRATITVNRTESTMLEDRVGYIALHEFAGESAGEFVKAYDELKAQGAEGLIIDLRDNGGGWVDDALKIADVFLDEGVLVYAQDRFGDREDFKTKDGKEDIPLVFLVNGNSASSSEILSGGLQDLGRATVVGTQTFGKGIIQAVNKLSTGEGGFALTYAQYFLPSGKAVHKTGITPDVISELPEGSETVYYELGDMSDPQLRDAWNAVKQKMEKKD